MSIKLIQPTSTLAIYITGTEDYNGAFKKASPDLVPRATADGLRGLDLERYQCSTLEEISSSVYGAVFGNGGVFGKGFRPLFKLVLRMHGSEHSLSPGDPAHGGSFSIPFSLRDRNLLEKTLGLIQPGGMVIVESCEAGKGDDNILKAMARLCRPDVCVFGNQTKGPDADPKLQLGSNVQPGVHFRDFRFINVHPLDRTEQDVTRIYYKTISGRVTMIAVEKLQGLFQDLLQRNASIHPHTASSTGFEEEVYELSLRLLGSCNDPAAFPAVKKEHASLITSIFGDLHAVDKIVGHPSFSPFVRIEARFGPSHRLNARENHTFVFEHLLLEFPSLQHIQLVSSQYDVQPKPVSRTHVEDLFRFFESPSKTGASSSSTPPICKQASKIMAACIEWKSFEHDLVAFEAIKCSTPSREILASMPSHDRIRSLFLSKPLTSTTLADWSDILLDLYNCAHEWEGITPTTRPNISITADHRSGNVHEDSHGNVQNIMNFVHPYAKAYCFLLGCAHIMENKALFMLLDTEWDYSFSNPAVLPIYWSSGILIHPDKSSKTGISAILAGHKNVFDIILESHALAEKQGLLVDWFKTAFKGVCFNQFSRNILDFYEILLSSDTDVPLPGTDPTLSQPLALRTSFHLGIDREDSGIVIPYTRLAHLARFVKKQLTQINSQTTHRHNEKGIGCLTCGGAIALLEKDKSKKFVWKEKEALMRMGLESLPESTKTSLYSRMSAEGEISGTSGDPDAGKTSFLWNLHKVIVVIDDEMYQIAEDAGLNI